MSKLSLFKIFTRRLFSIITCNKCNKIHTQWWKRTNSRSWQRLLHVNIRSILFLHSISFCFCPSYAMFSSLVTNNGVGLSWIFTQYQTRASKSVCNNTSVIFEFDRLSWIMLPLLGGCARLFLDTERKTEQWLDASRSMMFAMNMEDLSMIIVGNRTYVFIKKKIEKGNPPVISLPYVIEGGS